MGGSIKILGFFALGVFLGYKHYLPVYFLNHDLSAYALYALMFLVGLLIGLDRRSLELLRKASWRLFLLPVGTVLGTYSGVLVLWIFWKFIGLKSLLAIASGFGYYSLSSIIIADLKGGVLAVIALLSNIFRELLTLLLTPVFVRYFGPLSPIMSGGATSMDTALPVITRYSGQQYALLAVFNGLVLTVLVPFAVTLFCEL